MILIGQFDSPFARRVAIALKLYGVEYEHRPWSIFSDADKIAPFNPLCRVPTLVLDFGDVLIESAMILDYLDEQAGDARAMIASSGTERREALKVCARWVSPTRPSRLSTNACCTSKNRRCGSNAVRDRSSVC